MPDRVTVTFPVGVDMVELESVRPAALHASRSVVRENVSG